ncbi:AgmX/PglI C-terminal domain-containing protein [Polyangium sorediatum]|uniref:AgmX/PglI C-terminal domain-containing protein n=1 Tax=Polyangium sorediatum TaxID=889274 RepID=A0ABT6NJ69_9BACT|nr:AgmX/PglI C-terminal domain-containing protein [Polyangium sorediatum]MDI1428338.1 AgmX/PglI C-terminal domain-containing protein [Polyangium sorediatum]
MTTLKHSILSLTIGLFSALCIGGCAADAAGIDEKTTAEAASESGNAKSDYGYEMKDLRLVAGEAVPAADAVTPDGRVAPEEVLRQANTKIPALRACYAEALKKEPGLSGKVIVRMHVEASGAVSSSRVSGGSIGDAALGTCLAKELGSMTLPAATKGVLEVIFPIELDPADLTKGAPAGA